MKNTELLAQVATLYYERGLKQQEIARIVGVSRSKISRLLSEARNRGIVEIRVRQPLSTSTGLEGKLTSMFRLRDCKVLIAPSPEPSRLLRGLGALAARYVENLLEDISLIGLSWGTSLYEVVNAMTPHEEARVDVVQIIGSIGSFNQLVDGTSIAIRLADLLGGHARYLPAPLVVESVETWRALMQAPEVRNTIALAREADLILAGIGSSDPDVSALVRSGYLSKSESEALRRVGVVGDICGRPFDIQGCMYENEFSRRIVGLSLQELKEQHSVIGVAGGVKKAPAILGALRGGYVQVVVTDDRTAKEIIRLAEGTPPTLN